MGYLTHAFIAICVVALSCNRISGQVDYDDNDPMALTGQNKEFFDVFVDNVINSDAFSKMTEDNIEETTDILFRAFQLLKQSRDAAASQKKTLMVAFASSMAQLILNRCDTTLDIEDKAEIITNALRQAYIKTTGKPNNALLVEIKYLISLFLKLESPSHLHLYGRNPGFGPPHAYGVPPHHFAQPHHFAPPVQPVPVIHPVPVPEPKVNPAPPVGTFPYNQIQNGNFKLYYLNGTEVPQSEMPKKFQPGQTQQLPSNVKYGRSVSEIQFGPPNQIYTGQYEYGSQHPGGVRYEGQYPGHRTGYSYGRGPQYKYGHSQMGQPQNQYGPGGELQYSYGTGGQLQYSNGPGGQLQYSYRPGAKVPYPYEPNNQSSDDEPQYSFGQNGQPQYPYGPDGQIQYSYGHDGQIQYSNGHGGQIQYSYGPDGQPQTGGMPLGPGGQPLGPDTTPPGPGGQPTGPDSQPQGPKNGRPLIFKKNTEVGCKVVATNRYIGNFFFYRRNKNLSSFNTITAHVYHH